MKTLFIFSIVLFNLVFQEAKEPFKKANVIKIQTNLEGNESFIKWGKHLSQNGYSIDKSNKDFLTIETSPRDTKRFNYEYKVFSSVDEKGIITITIKWRLKSNLIVGTDGTDYYDWEYAQAKGNVQKIIFDELYETILSFGSYEVFFEKR